MQLGDKKAVETRSATTDIKSPAKSNQITLILAKLVCHKFGKIKIIARHSYKIKFYFI